MLSGISESVKNFKQGRSVEVVTFLAWSPAGLTLNAVYPPTSQRLIEFSSLLGHLLQSQGPREN